MIIHIHNSKSNRDSSHITAVSEWIAALDAEVTVCDDVYRGLARLLRDGASTARAVLVCVDDLRTSDFEFFRLVARHRRDIPVYVYGADRGSPRWANALKSGATGELTRAVIESLGSDSCKRTAPEDRPFAATQAASIPREVSAISGQDTGEPVERSGVVPKRDADEIELVPDESSEQTVRVPWATHADRPVRRGPGRNNVADDASTRVGATRPQSHETTEARRHEGVEKRNNGAGLGDRVPSRDAFEPLLTAEELEALMNDDLDVMSPDEREMLTGGDASSDGGRH